MRKDLSKSQQAVQAGHAVAEYLLRGPFTFWGNGTLVYLGVRDKEELTHWNSRITDFGYETAEFYEPDMDNEITAFAVECDEGLVKRLKLL